MNRNGLTLLVVVVLLLSCVAPSVNVASASQVTGIYGDLSRDKATGDMSGIEIFIMHSNDGYYVTYQCAAGEVAAPVLVRAKVIASVIEFSVPDSFKFFCNYGQFRGVITQEGITGKFQDNKSEIFLKRKRSIWQ